MLASPEARVGACVDDRYRLLAVLGQGGMGVVYEAVHEQTGRTVALKTLHPRLARDAAASQRFLREIRTAGMFEHPNLTEVLDAGTDTDGTLYVVMPRLRGRTLEEVLRSGPLEPALTAGVVLPVLEALAFMHARGAIHRDLKPSNVFLHVDASGTTVVKILDFGLARLVVQERGASTQGVIGTPHYMAPEQARGRGGVGPAADVWSVGVLAYECLTGDVPFGGTPTEALAAILSNQPIPALPPTVPRPLARLLEGMLVRVSDERPANGSVSLARWREAIFEARLRPALPAFARPEATSTGDPPTQSSEPTSPSAPVVATQAPVVATKAPAHTSEPDATKAHAHASEPDATKAPAHTSEPDATKAPAHTSEPDVATKAPAPPRGVSSTSPARPPAGSMPTLVAVAGVLVVGLLGWLVTRGGNPTPVEAASPPRLDAGSDAQSPQVDAATPRGDAGPEDARVPRELDARVAAPIPSEPPPAEPTRGPRRRRVERSDVPAAVERSTQPVDRVERSTQPAEAAPRGPNDTPIVPWR
ncbi:MAG: protein kinase [Polyangiales bacterium]